MWCLSDQGLFAETPAAFMFQNIVMFYAERFTECLGWRTLLLMPGSDHEQHDHDHQQCTWKESMKRMSIPPKLWAVFSCTCWYCVSIFLITDGIFERATWSEQTNLNGMIKLDVTYTFLDDTIWNTSGILSRVLKNKYGLCINTLLQSYKHTSTK